MSKKKFVVIVNCQGQPFYYFYKTLLGALFGYTKLYTEGKKYGWKITLKESVCLNGCSNIQNYEIKKR